MGRRSKEETEAISNVANAISNYVDYYTSIADTKPINEPETDDFIVKRALFMLNTLNIVYDKKLTTEDISKLNYYLFSVLLVMDPGVNVKYKTIIEDLKIKYSCKENVINIILGIYGAVLTYDIDIKLLKPIMKQVIEDQSLDQYLENTSNGKKKWLDYIMNCIVPDLTVCKDSMKQLVTENKLGKYYVCWLFTKDTDEPDVKYSILIQLTTDKDIAELKGLPWETK